MEFFPSSNELVLVFKEIVEQCNSILLQFDSDFTFFNVGYTIKIVWIFMIKVFKIVQMDTPNKSLSMCIKWNDPYFPLALWTGKWPPCRCSVVYRY